jgi:hypothetical protein
MSQKSSLPQAASSVSQVLKRGTCAPAPSVAVPVRIGVGVARPRVLAICARVELRAITGVRYHRLRQRRCHGSLTDEGSQSRFKRGIRHCHHCFENFRALSVFCWLPPAATHHPNANIPAMHTTAITIRPLIMVNVSSSTLNIRHLIET